MCKARSVSMADVRALQLATTETRASSLICRTHTHTHSLSPSVQISAVWAAPSDSAAAGRAGEGGGETHALGQQD